MTIDDLISKLRRELYNTNEGRDDHERGYRLGWVDRSRSLIADLEALRTHQGLTELTERAS